MLKNIYRVMGIITKSQRVSHNYYFCRYVCFFAARDGFVLWCTGTRGENRGDVCSGWVC